MGVRNVWGLSRVLSRGLSKGIYKKGLKKEGDFRQTVGGWDASFDFYV